jgi:hypothetical protein
MGVAVGVGIGVAVLVVSVAVVVLKVPAVRTAVSDRLCGGAKQNGKCSRR